MKNSIEKRCNLKTERLTISSHQNQVDKQNLTEQVIGILTPNVTKSLPDGWQNINTTNQAEKWINERANESLFLVIELNDSADVIGFVFLYEDTSTSQKKDLRFGYLLSENYWGKDIGTEIVQGLIKWCQNSGDIQSISGGVEKDNIGSIKVLEKCGFKVIEEKNSPSNVIFYGRKF